MEIRNAKVKFVFDKLKLTMLTVFERLSLRQALTDNLCNVTLGLSKRINDYEY